MRIDELTRFPEALKDLISQDRSIPRSHGARICDVNTECFAYRFVRKSLSEQPKELGSLCHCADFILEGLAGAERGVSKVL